MARRPAPSQGLDTFQSGPDHRPQLLHTSINIRAPSASYCWPAAGLHSITRVARARRKADTSSPCGTCLIENTARIVVQHLRENVRERAWSRNRAERGRERDLTEEMRPGTVSLGRKQGKNYGRGLDGITDTHHCGSQARTGQGEDFCPFAVETSTVNGCRKDLDGTQGRRFLPVCSGDVYRELVGTWVARIIITQ